LFWLAVCALLALGCSPAENEPVGQVASISVDPAPSYLKGNNTSQEVFASTAAGERQGVWKGGPPPQNKQKAGISTYYRIKTGSEPGTITMVMRFEGVKSPDARVDFKLLDGARFEPLGQRNEWRLKPDVASQVSLTLAVPETVSYLTLNAFQNGRASARAFILETPQ
jgi:hypothetical protein